MASGGPSGQASSGPRSFDFASDDVLCAYDNYSNQDPSNGKRLDLTPKDFHKNRTERQLVSVYGQQDEYPKEEIIDAVEKCMKKYADNLVSHLEGISGRLSQLEIYCYKLERSIGEFRADMIRDQNQADTKLKSLEKHLQEVHRSIQILRDKQELAETQKELTKLQLAPKESSSSTQSQKSEEAVAPSPVPDPKHHNDTPEISNQHLALALPHQIPPTSIPMRTPDLNQLLMLQQQQQQQQQQQPAPYSTNQLVKFYPQQSQTLQHGIQYIHQRPQIQDSTQASPQPQNPQLQLVSQATPQPFPQYQQPSQQFAQQPTSQSQLVRPRTPPTYISYTHQAPNAETFTYSTAPQSTVIRSEPMPFGYGSSVNIPPQPQQQARSQSSFGMAPPKAIDYSNPAPYPSQSSIQGYNTVYGIDANRVRYLPPSSAQVVQNQQLPPSNNISYHHPGAQLIRTHPYADMIEKATSMGFPRDQVIGVVNRMAETGQPVDFNALLDLLNSGPASGLPTRAWSG